METVAQILSSVASFVFFASLKASMLVALVLLIQRLFSRVLSANSRYVLWFAVVISLVTPFGFETVLPEFPGLKAVVNSHAENRSLPLSAPGEAGTHGQRYSPQSPGVLPAESSAGIFTGQAEGMLQTGQGFTMGSPIKAAVAKLLQVLPWFWLAGVLVFAVAMVVSSYRFLCLVRQSAPAPATLAGILEDCMQKTGCRKRVRLLLSPRLQSPLIAGVFRPVLLWPKGLEKQLTTRQVQHVFIHELMHLKRLDIVDNCVTAVLQALYWFNPAIWFAFTRMRNDREMACDESTLKHLHSDDRRAYAHTLIHLGSTLTDKVFPAGGLAVLDKRSQLHQRILMLVGTSLSHRIQLALTALLFIPLTVMAFGQPTSAPIPVRAERPVQGVVDSATEERATEETATKEKAAEEKAAQASVPLSPESAERVEQARVAMDEQADNVAGIPVELPAELSVDQLPAEALPVKVQQEVIELKPAIPVTGEPVPVTPDSAVLPQSASASSETKTTGSNDIADPAPADAAEVTELLISRTDDALISPTSAPVMAAVSAVSEEQGSTVQSVNASELLQPNLLESTVPQEQTICRFLTAAGSETESRVCDTAQNWAEFDRVWLPGEDPAAVTANTASGNYAIQIEYEVCRYPERDGSFRMRLKTRECRSAAEWAAIDTLRQNRTDELRRRVLENSGMTMTGMGSTPADMEAMSFRFPGPAPAPAPSAPSN